MQKLFPFVKIAEQHGDVPIHFNFNILAKTHFTAAQKNRGLQSYAIKL